MGPSRMDAFMRYCLARRRREVECFGYRAYVTNSLQLSPQNKYLGKKWSDIVRPPEPVDGAQIVKDVASRMGLEVL